MYFCSSMQYYAFKMCLSASVKCTNMFHVLYFSLFVIAVVVFSKQNTTLLYFTELFVGNLLYRKSLQLPQRYKNTTSLAFAHQGML